MSDEKTIYVVTHKNFDTKILKEGYKVIKVGNLQEQIPDSIEDNTGDNISDKNANYCELTALYWIWKNRLDVVGITHYRRFFCKNILNKYKKNVLEINEIEKMLKKYSIIIPEPMIVQQLSVLAQYNNSHYKKDLLKCGDIIKRIYPAYSDSFQYIINSKCYSQFNMMICQKKQFDSYCKWLFDILNQAEKEIDISDYDDYNKRIFGFLSEILFNVWLYKNKEIKIKRLPVVFTYDRYNLIKLLLGRIKYKVRLKKFLKW